MRVKSNGFKATTVIISRWLIKMSSDTIEAGRQQFTIFPNLHVHEVNHMLPLARNYNLREIFMNNKNVVKRIDTSCQA